jgi:hypothetical protein
MLIRNQVSAVYVFDILEKMKRKKVIQQNHLLRIGQALTFSSHEADEKRAIIYAIL